MSIKIFYFSGTGNSFYAAKILAQHFAVESVESISALRNLQEYIIREEEIVIVCPIYFYNIPPIVEKFLEQIQFVDAKYVSFVFTAEFPNGIAIRTVKAILGRKNVTVRHCFYVKMPTNYVIKSKMLGSDEVEAVFEKANKKLNRIIKIIETGKNYSEKDSKLYSIVVDAEKKYAEWEKAFPVFDSGFAALGNCNGCKLCEKRCPVGNIVVHEKPTWSGACEACLKCINICPKQAIQYDNKTEGRLRYFHHMVKIDEFM